MSRRILVTGAAGAIGRAVRTHLLGRGHAVTGLDRGDGPAPWFTGSIQDDRLVDAAVAGQETIIHLAATPDQADFISDLLPNNVGGTYRILQAALRHGVKRVVLASTLRTVSLRKRLDRDWIPDEEAEARPHDEYSLSKVMCEDMGSFFHYRHGIEVVCARIGWFLRNPEESANFLRHAAKSDPQLMNYLSHADCVRFFAAAAEAPQGRIGFERCFVVSHNAGRSRYPSPNAERAFGWKPTDSYPEGTPASVLGHG